MEANGAPVAATAVLVRENSADVTVRAVTEVRGENRTALTERVVRDIVDFQKVRNLCIGALKEIM